MKKIVYVGNIPLGSGRVIVQSMTNTLTSDVESTKKQIVQLHGAGAELVRVSIPDLESADAIKELKTLNIPLIGDIHYNHKLAIAAIENGIDKIRINPSNMIKGGVSSVVSCCKAHNVPIRVGVNKGSVKNSSITPKQLAELAMQNVSLIESRGYNNIVVAVKSSDIKETVHAYRYLDKICDYPLHIGLTESGTIENGMLKSAIAIGGLLLDGIGDTVRVSLSGDPINEVYAAKKILKLVGVDKNFVDIISCPTCARTCINVEKIANRLTDMTAEREIPLKIAVMGCTVNGIGESKGADFGVAGGKERSAIFVDGEIVKTVENCEIENELIALVTERLANV